MSKQDLKTGQWDHFFDELQPLCNKHLPSSGTEFFVMLMSQVVQRMLKASPATKGMKDPQEMQFLTSFFDQLLQHEATVDQDTVEMVRHCKTVMDLTSVRSEVDGSLEALSSSDHWLAKAFHLDKGKKVLHLAKENAEKRATQSDVLDALAAKIRWLEDNSAVSFPPESQFASMHGQMNLGRYERNEVTSASKST